MSTGDDTVQRIRQQVGTLGAGHWLLAVSGGIDSMVLLDAAANILDRRALTVATFDHGTGSWATNSAELASRRALECGLSCVAGRAGAVGRSEAQWRAERWHFLRETADKLRARVVTAHTADDQIETFVIRELRGAGPRGLAGLAARSSVARPLLGTFRAEIVRYAILQGLEYASDPSNEDRRHLRNRVRLDLLPALERASPGFRASIHAVAEKASDWRARMEAIALTFPMMTESAHTHSFERGPLRSFNEGELRCLWPALAARAGAILDRRGTTRLAEFTIEGATGQQIQLSGGIRVHMQRRTITFSSDNANG